MQSRTLRADKAHRRQQLPPSPQSAPHLVRVWRLLLCGCSSSSSALATTLTRSSRAFTSCAIWQRITTCRRTSGRHAAASRGACSSLALDSTRSWSGRVCRVHCSTRPHISRQCATTLSRWLRRIPCCFRLGRRTSVHAAVLAAACLCRCAAALATARLCRLCAPALLRTPPVEADYALTALCVGVGALGPRAGRLGLRTAALLLLNLIQQLLIE